MKHLSFAIVLFCFLPLGCAAISEQARLEEYGRTMDSYETAMRLSDFNAACQYVDPSAMSRSDCLNRYDNLKMVSYEVLRMNLSKDNREVTQTVDVEYYFLDRYIAKKLQYEQSWRYQEEEKTWVLNTGPPLFK
ncbi:hypothetical protein DSCA_43440 [Desulfosarcina alkanivorans]|uniref:Lipoprotein n=1 Tax=Desulfosarcina alkanivorans TaxID=571177 RepID=A0A5K7YVS9_9BACT|nr:hypothetical protein [Desulfosarcina alkanivorans]BBO70414.1 hypothetical protein DSCA_43440 [Desulfosarcina alkanivorans]